jgi:hypothetical protein
MDEDRPIASPHSTRENTNTEKRRYISMPRVGFNLMISVFERHRTANALNRSAIVTDHCVYQDLINII